MRALLLLAAACAASVPPPGPANPASPRAATGRLAGPPATLRPGAIVYRDVPPLRAAPPPMHHHHHP
ncbi:MAG TPA: hypothetical protein VGF94_12455 [Kofleriaceae bacterium]|jgi:hypothetical protein